jgi:error-prone DNA polymerase
VFVDYATGYRQSPYADVGTPGDATRETRRMAAAETSQERADQRQRRGDPPRKLWHASPGSSGR